MPLGITHVWISNCIAQKKQGVSCQYYSGDSLSHPVKQTRSREVSYVSYHIQTPINTISTAEITKTNCAPNFPPSSVSPIPKSIIKWRIPAVKWYISPERRPHTTNLASGLVKHSLTSANPCSDASDLSSPYNSTAIPKNRMTPVILCKMEEIAVSGSFIVLRSRFTGRWLFTAYSHLESPKLQGELSGRHLLEVPVTIGVTTASMKAKATAGQLSSIV